MPRNIEIKASIDRVEALIPLVEKIADTGPIEIHQDDTFFSCSHGRLKLRTFSDHEGELIFYQRADIAGPKESSYVISLTTTPDTLRGVLALAYGETGRICKHRTLFMAGRTRIHLDRVDGLGHFLELEVVLSEDEPGDAGVLVAREILRKLCIGPDQLVEGAYVDLLR